MRTADLHGTRTGSARREEGLRLVPPPVAGVNADIERS